MNLKQYLFIMLFGTVLCWVAWFFVILNVDPFQDNGTGLTFFYVSLALALLGTVSVLSFSLRNYFSRRNLPMFRYVQRSFKDAFVVSVIFVLMLFLQGKGYLNWWNTGVFILALVLGIAFVWTTKHQGEKNNINFK